MTTYEIMFIVHPDLEVEEHEAIKESINQVITKLKGEVIKVIDWKKRKLAYEINKLREGHYYLLYFAGDNTIIPELDHFFRVSDVIIRNMIVRVEEENIPDTDPTEDSQVIEDKGSEETVPVQGEEQPLNVEGVTETVDAANILETIEAAAEAKDDVSEDVGQKDDESQDQQESDDEVKE